MDNALYAECKLQQWGNMRNVNHKFSHLLVALLCLFVTNLAHAGLGIYSCTHPIYGVNGSGGYGTAYTSGACIGGHTANASSTLVTSSAVLQTAANQVHDMIHARLQHLQDPSQQRLASAETLLGSGVSTGDTFSNFAVWVNGSWNKIKNDFAPTAFDGHVATAAIGVDALLEAYHLILGLAVGWEDQNLTTHFNRGEQDATGWSITPYASFMFDPHWSVSAYGGYAAIDYDLKRSDPATWGAITGSADASRWYIGGDLNLHLHRTPTRFDAHMGLMYMTEDRDAYGETGAQTVSQPSHKTDLGRFRVGANLGYLIKQMFEPYVKGAVLWDFNHDDITVAAVQQTPPDSSIAVLTGVGLNIFVLPNVYFNVEGYAEHFRQHYDKYGVSGNVLVTFG